MKCCIKSTNFVVFSIYYILWTCHKFAMFNKLIIQSDEKNSNKLGYFLTTGSLILLSFLVSCNNNDEVADNLDSKKESVQNSLWSKREMSKDDFSKINESTKLLSKTIINLGVKEIEKNGNFYSFKTFRTFKIQDRFVNLSEFEFEYSDHILSFKKDKSYQIYSVANQFYLKTPTYNGMLENITAERINNDENILYLLLFFGEFTNDSSRTTFETVQIEHQAEYSTSGTGCSFWNTYYSVGIGLNQAAADANFIHNLKDDMWNEYSSHTHCWSLGRPEKSNFAHVYYVSQAFCCTG